MSKYQPYTSYKDSGIEWLGDVPEHWRITPLKLFADITLGKMLTSVDKGGMLNKPYLRAKNLRWESVDVSDVKNMWFEPYELKKLLLKKGDLLVSEGGEVGRTCIWNDELEECYIQNSVNRVQLKAGESRYFLYQFVAAGKYGYFDSIVNRISIAHLTKDKLGSVSFAFPLREEQSAIANFLDQETGKMDLLIEKQQTMIGLLKEKRQAVISHAVTKGLNPKAPMKDSGIKWLGQIPENWEVGSLKRYSSRCVVGIAEAATHAYADKGVPILRATNIRSAKIIGKILYLSPEFANSSERLGKKIKAGDLITVRTGNAGVTAIASNDFDGAHCFTMLVTSLQKGNSNMFFEYFINSDIAQSYFNIEGWGTAQMNISVPILQNLPTAIPCSTEQQDIVNYLDVQTQKIDTLIEKSQQAIALLKERKTALISAAVTGKIDVRNLYV